MPTAKTPIEKLPFIEELLMETGTTRNHWLFGASDIAAALGVAPYCVYQGTDGVNRITRRIRSDGARTEALWVALKADVLAYREARKPKPAALIVNQNGQGPAAPPPPPLERIGLTPDTLKDIHDLRVDVQGLRSDLTSLRQSVNELARVIDNHTDAAVQAIKDVLK